MFQALPAALTDLVADYVGCRRILRVAWPTLFTFEGLAQPIADDEKKIFCEDALESGDVGGLAWLVAMRFAPDFDWSWLGAAKTVEGCEWLLRYLLIHEPRDQWFHALDDFGWKSPLQVEALYRYSSVNDDLHNCVAAHLGAYEDASDLEYYLKVMHECGAGAKAVQSTLHKVLKSAARNSVIEPMRVCIAHGSDPAKLCFTHHNEDHWAAILELYRNTQPDPNKCLIWLYSCLAECYLKNYSLLSRWLQQIIKQIQAEVQLGSNSKEAKVFTP